MLLLSCSINLYKKSLGGGEMPLLLSLKYATVATNLYGRQLIVAKVTNRK